MSLSGETLKALSAQLAGPEPEAASLSSHLCEVFTRCTMHNKLDAFDKFEEVSALVKKTQMRHREALPDHAVNAKAGLAGAAPDPKWAATKNLLAGNTERVSASDKDLISKKQCAMASVGDDCAMLEWAGVCFGEADAYKLQHSMKRLAAMSGADGLRFCGKIYGTCKDYWVVSGSMAEAGSSAGLAEPRGTGVNALVYWVTEDLLQDWVQLPDCKPEHIVAARCVKRVMTGNLNATVPTNPPFPGQERHFLRAQLARIFHATTLHPKGMFNMEALDDTEGAPEVMKVVEDFQFPASEDLKAVETWGNTYPQILNAGTASHIAPAGIEDDAEWRETMEAKEPTGERFRSAAEHKGMPGTGQGPPEDPGHVAWTSKAAGDQQRYTKAGSEDTVAYCVNVVRSLRWPGAITVAAGGRFTSVYLGTGVKRGDASFSPTDPPDVMKDPSDPVDQPEPTPLHEPEAKQEDDAAAKEKEGEDSDY